MAEERVILTAELKDLATAPLDKLEKKLDSTARTAETAGKTMDRAVRNTGKNTQSGMGAAASAIDKMQRTAQLGMGAAGNAADKLVTRMAGSNNAMIRFAGRTGQAAQGALNHVRSLGGARGIFNNFKAQAQSAGREAYDALAGNKYTGRVTRGVTDFVAGMNDAQAAASSFTGRMGTLGGAAARVVGPISRGLQSIGPEAARGASSFVSAAGRMAASAAQTGGRIASNLASGIHQGVSAIGKGVAVAGAAIGGIAVAGGFKRAVNIENAEAMLKGLGNSAKQVEKIMENASASVTGTAFGLDAAATTAAGAVAAGIKPGEDLERMLKSVANSAAATKMPMDEMGAIFNKVAATGKAQGDVIAQVNARGLPLTAKLAEQLGVTADEAMKMASQGKIGFKEFEKAMIAASGTVAVEMGKTFEGARANARAALSRIGEVAVKPVMKLGKGLFNAVIPIANGIKDAITPIFTSFDKGAAKSAQTMEDWGKRVGAAITLVSGILQGGSLKDEKMVSALKVFSDQGIDVKPIVEKITWVKDAVTGLRDIITKGDFTSAMARAFNISDDEPIVGFLVSVHESLDKLKPVFGAVFGAGAGGLLAMGTSAAGALPFIGQFIPAISPIVGVLGGLIAASPELRSALGGVFGELGKTAQALLPALEPLGETFIGMFTTLGEALAKIIPVLGEGLTTILTSLVTALVPVGEALGEVATIFADTLAEVLPILIPPLAEIITKFVELLPALMPIVVEVAKFIGQLVTGLSPILPVILGLLGTLMSVFMTLFPPIAQIIQIVGEFAAELLQVLMPVLTPLFEALSQLLPPIAGLIGSLLKLIVSVLRPIMPVLTSVAKIIANVLGAAIKLVTPVIDLLVKGFTKLVQYLSGPVKKIVETISGAFKALTDTIGKVLEGIGKVGENVGGFIGDVGENVANFFTGNSGGGIAGHSGGGVVQASGGLVRGYQPGVDSVPAMLSPGEAVLVPELTKAIGPKNIMALNRQFSNARTPGSGPSTGAVVTRAQAAPTAVATRSAPSGGSTTQIIIGEGAVQVVIHATGDNGVDTNEVKKTVKEALKELMDEIERRGY